MEKGGPPAGFLNPDNLTQWLRAGGLRRVDLCKKLGMMPGAFATRLSRPNPFVSAEVAIILEFFGSECQYSDLFVAAHLARPGRKTKKAVEPTPYDQTYMAKLYAEFTGDDFLCVFSIDGFLEAKEPWLENSVVAAVKRGLEIFYFFPDSPLAQKSIDDFEDISGKLKRRLSGPEFEKNVHGHLLSGENPYVCTRATRFVLVGKRDQDARKINRVLLYLHSGRDYWIELDPSKHEAFLAALGNAIDPIPYRPLASWRQEWRLPDDRVRQAYQTGFSDNELKTYSELRKFLGTKASAERMAIRAHEHLLEVEFPREKSVLRWLDIGSAEGTSTAAVHRYLKSHGFKIALTAIDTSRQQHPDPLLQYSTFLDGPQWAFEEFHKLSPREEKFDLITCLHGWYLIDPIYIVEAYRKLSKYGILIVTMGSRRAGTTRNVRATARDESAFAGNFVNELTGVIDATIAPPSAGRVVYSQKVIRDDPIRNYAEDIAKACEVFFGDPGIAYHLDVHNKQVPASMILNGAGLTDLGKEVTKFFTHGLPVPNGNERLFARVHKALAGLISDGKLPASEIDLSVKREQVLQYHHNRLRFTTSNEQ